MRLMPIAVYLAGAILASALLAYPLWAVLTAVGMEGLPFHKFTFRLLEACALIGLWPLMSHLKMNTADGFGLSSGTPGGRWLTSRWGGMAAGFAAGVGVLGIIVLGLLLLDVRAPRMDVSIDAGLIVLLLSKALITGFVVGFIEELWLRGALQGALQQRAGVALAIGATALLYGLGHFIRPDLQIPAEDLGFGSGLEIIAGSFGRFADARILYSLPALVAVGVLLSLVRLRSGRIWECIGLHAGFVAVIRMSRELTVVNPGSPHQYLAGDFDGIVGMFACLVFAALAFSYWRIGALAVGSAK